MRRKTSDTPTRIWTFRCSPPLTEQGRVREQLSLSHRYYNALIEIEKNRREAYREARSKIADIQPLEEKQAELTTKIDEVRDRVKRASALARKKITPSVADKQLVRDLQTARKVVREELRAMREKLKTDPWLKSEAEKINDLASANIRAARAASGLYWGTYLLVEKAVESARKSPSDPKFRRWTGQGRVGVQVHGVLTTQQLFEGKGTVLQIDPLPEDTWDTRSGRRHAKTKARIRVGSVGKDPLWAEFMVVVHRKLPAGVIKWAWLKISRVGPDTRYELQITVESAAFKQGRQGTGVAALDIGWRLFPDRIRLGVVADDRGKLRELSLPRRILEGVEFCDRLRGFQDVHFNSACDSLRTWTANNPVPEWMQPLIAHIHQWRAPSRLARVVRRWRESHDAELHRVWELWKKDRLSAGSDLFDEQDVIASFAKKSKSKLDPVLVYLDFWLRKDLHLYRWQCHYRDKLLARRREIFRCWAAELAEQYEFLVVEDMDLTKWARNSTPEDGTSAQDFIHRLRNVAAPGELRGILVSTFGKERIFAADPAFSTADCFECGHRNEWPDSERQKVQLVCSSCKREWDQDENAAKNLLHLFLNGEQRKAV